MRGWVPVSPQGYVFWYHAKYTRSEAIKAVTDGPWNVYYRNGWRIVRCDVVIKEAGAE